MSYNITAIDLITQDGFRLPIEHVEALKREIGDEHPESWLFDEPETSRPAYEDRDSYLYFSRIDWQGEGSGYTFDTFLEKVLPRFRGFAELVVCWEGGDSYTGIRVKDGVVTQHKVVHSLGEETK